MADEQQGRQKKSGPKAGLGLLGGSKKKEPEVMIMQMVEEGPANKHKSLKLKKMNIYTFGNPAKYQMDFLHLPESFLSEWPLSEGFQTSPTFSPLLATSSEAVCVFSTSFMSLKLSSDHHLVSFPSHWLFLSKHHHGQHLTHSEEDGNCWPALLLWLLHFHPLKPRQ